ncbi:MAG: zinc-ribbon domain-containing protein [Clostridia bacterium]|nr:zinc-ribbon domain-containing protein [Clostridia bacterium]
MFCPHCGNNIPDNSAFCGHCGASFAAAPAAAPVAVAAPTVPGLSAKKRGLSKKQFLATEAAPEVKTAGKLALAFFAALMAVVLISTVVLNTISIVDLPIIKMAVEEDEREELINSMDEASDAIDKMEKRLEDIEKELGSKAAREAKNVVKKWEKLVRKISLANLIAVVDATHKLADDVSDKLGMDSEIEELEEIAKILKTVRTITYVFAAIIILLTLLAAAKKLTGVAILAQLLFTLVCVLLISVPLAVCGFVLYIALAITTSKVNKAWKTAAV